MGFHGFQRMELTSRFYSITVSTQELVGQLYLGNSSGRLLGDDLVDLLVSGGGQCRIGV